MKTSEMNFFYFWKRSVNHYESINLHIKYDSPPNTLSDQTGRNQGPVIIILFMVRDSILKSICEKCPIFTEDTEECYRAEILQKKKNVLRGFIADKYKSSEGP